MLERRIGSSFVLCFLNLKSRYSASLSHFISASVQNEVRCFQFKGRLLFPPFISLTFKLLPKFHWFFLYDQTIFPYWSLYYFVIILFLVHIRQVFANKADILMIYRLARPSGYQPVLFVLSTRLVRLAVSFSYFRLHCRAPDKFIQIYLYLFGFSIAV